ncbi:MAG: YbaN family protein [Spirochaetia bacterium]
MLFGIIFLTLGLIGIVLPILPTTPFLIAAAFFFVPSSRKLHSWLYSNRITAPHMRALKENKGMTMESKIIILSFAWLMLILGAFLAADILALRIGLPALGAIKTVLFFTVIKTVRKSELPG